jgi:hypothetical protein
MAKNRRAKRGNSKKNKTSLVLGRMINVFALLALLVFASFLLLSYYEENYEIGEVVEGNQEMFLVVNEDYGKRNTVDLCATPTCFRDGRYRPIKKIKNLLHPRKIFRSVEEYYFKNLPPVVWYYTRADKHGWVPRYMTSKKVRFNQWFIANNTRRIRLCPLPECSVGEETILIPTGTRLLATRIVYKYYRKNERATAWLYTRYDRYQGWVNIHNTDLGVIGPHYRKPAWKS